MAKQPKRGEKPVNMLGIFRKARGWTMRDAAKRCGVATSTIMRYEQGEDPRLSVFIKILRGYDFNGFADELERLGETHGQKTGGKAIKVRDERETRRYE